MSKAFDVAKFVKDIEEGAGCSGFYQVPVAAPAIFKDCERYVASHPGEFAGLLPADAVNRAFYLHSVGRIDVKK
jgi:hypothetical protein